MSQNILFSVLILFITFGARAQETSKSQILAKIADLQNLVEQDEAGIIDYLPLSEQIDDLVASLHGTTVVEQLIGCRPDPIFDQYNLYDKKTDQTIGYNFGKLSQSQCKKILSSSTRYLTCSPFNSDKDAYYLHDIQKGDIVGAELIPLETCQKIIAGSTRYLACQPFRIEENDFYIYNLRTKNTFGDSTSLENCQKIVSLSKKTLTCSKSFFEESFELRDLFTGDSILGGGNKSLESCLEEI
jgi:hypothetical protein